MLEKALCRAICGYEITIGNSISSAGRYDHFDTLPYKDIFLDKDIFLAQKQAFTLSVTSIVLLLKTC
jgi:hypothetical protein